MFKITADTLPRFMQCNGSRNMPASFPVTVGDTTDRDEGTAAHWLSGLMFAGQPTESLHDRKAPNGVYVTPEMVEYATGYVQDTGRLGAMEVETSFGTDDWRVAARADHIYHDQMTETLYVRDFKYGWGIVSPVRNWTLLAHAIGFCIFHSVVPQRIVLIIYQPRPYHSDGIKREWSLSYTELLEYYQQIAQAMSAPSDTLRTGPSCVKCRAFATCPAARLSELNAIDAIEEATFSDDVTNEFLAYEITTLETAAALAKARLEALQELAKHRLQNGQVVPGWRLEHQYANRRWKTGLSVDFIEAITGKKLHEQKLVTPAQAEKLGVSKDVTKMFTERPSTGIKLARGSVSDTAAKLLQGKAK